MEASEPTKVYRSFPEQHSPERSDVESSVPADENVNPFNIRHKYRSYLIFIFMVNPAHNGYLLHRCENCMISPL
jgi:hypothetical protein